MRMISTLALGAALSLAALPALAQQSGSGTVTSPGVTSPAPGTTVTPSPGSGANSSTSITNDRAPPAGTSGSRALTPGQNADGTPTNTSPGGQPKLPGMQGQN